MGKNDFKKDFSDEEYYLESFLQLPKKAQLMIFDQIDRKVDLFSITEWIHFERKYEKSPIEKIFSIAMDCLRLMMIDEEYKFPINFEISPQEEITANGKRYVVDFLITSCDRKYDLSSPIIVECDGHDYHSTKEQIAYGNERDMNLKQAGYEIIHFSGSQLFADPYGCAFDTFKYIKKRMVERKNGEN